MMCMSLSTWTHAHIQSWKLGPGLVLLAKVRPWQDSYGSSKSNKRARLSHRGVNYVARKFDSSSLRLLFLFWIVYSRRNIKIS